MVIFLFHCIFLFVFNIIITVFEQSFYIISAHGLCVCGFMFDYMNFIQSSGTDVCGPI